MVRKRQGRRLVGIGVGLLALLLVGAFLVPAASTEPELRFERTVLDLGELRTGTTSEVCFAFSNRGPERVEITSLRPGCGCLIPRLEKLVYEAGEAGTLPIVVKTLGEQARSHAWQLHLNWRSGGVEREEVLEVRGTLVSEINLQPASLTLHCSAGLKHELLLTDHRAVPMQVRALHTSSPHLHALAEPPQSSAGGWRTRVMVEVSPSCPEGRHEEKVVLTTDDPVYRQLEATVTIIKRTEKRLSVTPPAVELHGSGGRLLEVRDRLGAAVILRSVTASQPSLRCTWTVGPENASTIKVQLEPGAVAGELDAQLRIDVETPVRETLVVPVKCRVE